MILAQKVCFWRGRQAGWVRATGHVRSSLVKPRRSSGAGGDHLLDQGIGMAVVFALPVGEGFFCVRFKPLLFIKEDGRRTHEGEIARADGVAHQAMIFPLGVVAAVMLFDFDGPVILRSRRKIWAAPARPRVAPSTVMAQSWRLSMRPWPLSSDWA